LIPEFIKACENNNSFMKLSPYIQQVPNDNYNKRSKRELFKNIVLNNNILIIVNRFFNTTKNTFSEITKQLVGIFSVFGIFQAISY